MPTALLTPPIHDATRRQLLTGAAAVLLAGRAGSAAAAAAGSGFPVTIVHKFGSTEIPAEPRRVLSIGYKELDSILALGVIPIAVRYWFGDENDAVWPWAEDAAGGANPEVLNMRELNFEAIAARDPDLILGINSGMTAADYETLSAIAPTVAQTDDYIDFGVPWQVELRMIGMALGKTDVAQRRIGDLDARLAAVRRDHPEFADRTLALAVYAPDQVGVFASQDIRARVFSDFGFPLPPAFDELAGDQFYAFLSREQLELLDTDVLVWTGVGDIEGGRATIENDPLVAALAVTREQRSVFMEDQELDAALNFVSVLSFPRLIDELVPMLARAANR